MKAVSRFEADLLRILHALLGRTPLEGAWSRIVGRAERPRCLSRDAVLLVQDALAKGCVVRLARAGGWRPARHMRGERPASGRLWERTPPEELGLSFSRHSLKFLIWITAEHPGDEAKRWRPIPEELTVGDRLLLFFSYEALRMSQVARSILALPTLAGDGLIALAFPDDLAESVAKVAPDLSPWVEGVGAAVLEALQPTLAARWVEVERRKEQVAKADAMLSLGRVQETILEAALRALDDAGRRDLARFLLAAAEDLLRDPTPARARVAALDLKGLRVADRAGVYRAATAFLRALGRLRDWERQARAVGYFDEGYAAAQLWKSDWDDCGGENLCDRAGVIIRELDPMGA